MGRKNDLKEVDYIAAEGGLSPQERRDFSRYLHRCKKEGVLGTKNDRGDYNREELRARLREFLEGST